MKNFENNVENFGGSGEGSPNFLVDVYGVLLVEEKNFESIEDFRKGGLKINQNLLHFLSEKRHNGSKVAIISNVAQYFFEKDFWNNLTEVEREIFDAIVISGEVGVRKPEPRIFEIAFGRLGVPAENCVMIDDSAENVVVAKRCGARGVVYRDFENFEKEMEKLCQNYQR